MGVNFPLKSFENYLSFSEDNKFSLVSHQLQNHFEKSSPYNNPKTPRIVSLFKQYQEHVIKPTSVVKSGFDISSSNNHKDCNNAMFQ
jgi:hypothetical protein